MKTHKFISKTMSTCIALLVIASCTLKVVAKSPDKNSVLTVKDELEKAKKAGNAVFLVITGTGAAGVSGLITVANEANKKVKKSTVIQMNKDEAINSELVTKFGISGVPVPFVLVISPKGVACGGFPASQVTAEALANSVPSPKYDEVLFAINNKKPCFVIASKKTFTDRSKALANCKLANAKVSVGVTIIEVDMDDTKESALLKQLGVNITSTSCTTVVINAAGNITGSYPGSPQVQALVDAANKVVKSGGCCPAGSNSGCGPKK